MHRLVKSLVPVLLVIAVLVACAPPPAATPAPVETAAPARQATVAPKPQQTAAPAAAPTATPAKPSQPAAEPYYRGKTIEIISGDAAGGGTDTIARIAAPFLTKLIPGNPKIIIRNNPGSGGVVATNILYEKGKPDGLSLVFNSSSPIGMQLRQQGIVKFDLTRMKFMGHLARAESVLMLRKGQRDRLTNPRAQTLIAATNSGEASKDAMVLWAQEFLNWNVRWIAGFGGTSEVELAFRRGEIDMFATSNAFIVNRVFQEGLTENIAQIGGIKDGKFTRRSDFADVPTLEEVLGDKKPTGLPWQAYLSWVGPGAVDKFFVAPPGTPDNVMSVLVEAWGKLEKEPEFDKQIKKMVSEVYDIGAGKQTADLVKDILAAPPEALDYSKSLQKKYGLVK
ncbi:MAG: hypothetical protein HY673_26975 [Chloroflexi bacterium]|nr:hypothetical protein [Chloroflexota bacterium]